MHPSTPEEEDGIARALLYMVAAAAPIGIASHKIARSLLYGGIGIASMSAHLDAHRLDVRALDGAAPAAAAGGGGEGGEDADDGDARARGDLFDSIRARGCGGCGCWMIGCLGGSVGLRGCCGCC